MIYEKGLMKYTYFMPRRYSVFVILISFIFEIAFIFFSLPHISNCKYFLLVIVGLSFCINLLIQNMLMDCNLFFISSTYKGNIATYHSNKEIFYFSDITSSNFTIQRAFLFIYQLSFSFGEKRESKLILCSFLFSKQKVEEELDKIKEIL